MDRTETETIMGMHKQQGDLISLLLFFENEESRPKMSLSRLMIGNPHDLCSITMSAETSDILTGISVQMQG
jgi:hypothetical protein